MQSQHLVLNSFAKQSDGHFFKSVGTALGAMGLLVLLGGWRTYCAFQSFFELKPAEMALWSNEMWLCLGPVSLLVAAFLGLIFGAMGSAAKHVASRRLWSILLWVLFVWLIGGAVAFAWLDYAGDGPKSFAMGHIWNSLTIALPMMCGAACIFNIVTLFRGRPSSAAMVPSSRWKRVTATAARIVLWMGTLFGSILAALTSTILLFAASCSPPSLQTLAGRFPQYHRDLDTLVQMSDQDSDFYVIDPEWLASSAGDFNEDAHSQVVLSPYIRKDPSMDALHDPEAFMSLERWNDYRVIFRRNHITQGIRRPKPGRDIFFIVKSEGLAVGASSSSGYIHCSGGPEHTYPPCSSKETHSSQPFTTPDSEAYSFLKLADRWYAYSEKWA